MMHHLEILYQQLEEIKTEKTQQLANQHFERAAALRDTEKRLLEECENLEKKHRIKLSKSKYIKGMNCPKALWLYVHKYDQQEFSDQQETIFQQGTDIGELAQQLFPNGVLAVKPNEYPGLATAKYTRRLIEQGVTTIYEATFMYNNIVVAVDILDCKNGQWNAFEVKSTNSLKEVHISDASIQYYVMKHQLFLTTPEMYVIHFDSSYVRQGDLDLRKLFTADKITTQVTDLQPDIPANVLQLKKTLLYDEPNIDMGNQCISPYPCSFYTYCSKQQLTEEDLQPELSHEPIIDTSYIQKFVSEIDYPLGFFDFETIMPAVPMFDQSRPYQQITFQFSLHSLQQAQANLIHQEHLAQPIGDPRLQIIPSILQFTANLQTIFVYNISFERSRLQEMARDFPQYEKEILRLIEKLVDLMPIFRYYYRTESMGTKYSIKTVLPILIPEMSYEKLDINNGADASAIFYNLYQDTKPLNHDSIRQQLIDYCTMDTFALVKLWELLQKV
ncbi:MAG: DUF2779 domain-containing protein [Chitinophagaceae bacterium]|nr:DUF2779 domain-containing protein [Chitinophagaceae bacterium]